MSRNIAAGNAAKADDNVVIPVVFIHIAFDSPSGDVYLHDALGTINWNATDWLGVGDLGSIKAMEEGEMISPYAFQATLSGIDQQIVDEAVNQQAWGNDVNVYIGWLNATTHQLDDDPDLFWKGFVDDLVVTLGTENSVDLVAESELARFKKKNERMYTDASQQERHPGDTFFGLVPWVSEIKLRWGGDRVDVDGKDPNEGNPGYGTGYGPIY